MFPQQGPPPDPPPGVPAELSYASVGSNPQGAVLIKLAVIFNYVVAGLDVIAALGQLAMMGLMYYFMMRMTPPTATAPAMPALAFILYPFYALFASTAATLNFISARTLSNRGPWAFGWTLAAAIVDFFSLLWCSMGCILPLAAGVYLIVIVCLEQVRAELRRGDGAATPL
jgi:hypothetical protein